MEQQIRFCASADGTRIAYAIYGEDRGTPVVSVNGWTGSLELDWKLPHRRHVYESLAHGRRLVSFDRRGTGASQREVGDLSPEADLADLAAIVDHLGLERFDLAGWVDGSTISVAYAAGHPERVSHLIVWSPQLTVTQTGTAGTALLDVAGKNWRTYTESVAQSAFGWSGGGTARAFAGFIRRSVDQETWLKTIDCFDDSDATPLLAQVTATTLVLARPQSRIYDAKHVSTLASRIPNARVAFLAGTEPGLHLGDAEEGLRAISEFLREGEDVAGSSASAPGGLVTILFTDMESSTALRRKLGDAKVQELLHAHNQIVRAALGEHNGREIKHTGDGIMASFSTATSALQCAIAIQQGVAAHAEEHPDVPLAVYVGLNAGEPIAEGDPEGRIDLFGTSVDLARRICDHAQPGQILASNVVRELAEGKGFLFGDIGDVVPKGFDEAVRLYEVRWREGPN